MSIFLSILVSVAFFFAIIGVFGLWFAIDGLVIAIATSVYIFAKRPEQEQL